MRHSTDRRATRPVGPAAAARSKMLSRAWSLPQQRNFVAIERNVQVPMSDGAVLLADHYLPITSQPAATVLVRCPYGRGAPFSLLQAQLVAERGFHVLLQSCRGTFGSGGRFEPMRHEISDGQDTVAWLRGQSWFDGRLATFGASYLGFVQWALALDPPPAQAPHRWYLGPAGTLSAKEPADGTPVPPASFRYDPADPTPSAGGAILALNAGVRDNRAVEQRPDVLVFSSEPLDEPVEVVGDVTAELHVTRDNPNADLFVRMCDVDPPGDAKSRSRNVCDGIVRLTGTDPLAGTVRVGLIAAAHRFGRGHRIRLQVAGGAHPRFARNPGNGQVDASAKEFAPTRYEIGLSAEHPSALVLSAVSQTAGKAAAHA